MKNIFPQINNRKIRFALVGCGRIAKNHFAAMKQFESQCEIVGICDINPQALLEAEIITGAKSYNSLKEMLNKCEADIYILTTPSGIHSEQAIEIAKIGKHVMTEKPMATNWEDGKKMVKACEEAGVRLFVVKQNRRNSTLQLLKKAIDKKRFGKIYMVNINVFWTRPQSYYDQAAWRGTWSLDGGAFMNQASHYVDLITWLIGPLDSLFSFTSTMERKIEAEDTGVISLRWKSGALGTMNVTMLTYPNNLEGSITILGEKGTVRIGGNAVNEIQNWEFEDEDEDDHLVKEVSYKTTSVYGFGHPLYYENVIKVMRGDAEPETDGYEGLKSLEVIIAAYLSAKHNKPISFPISD